MARTEAKDGLASVWITIQHVNQSSVGSWGHGTRPRIASNPDAVGPCLCAEPLLSKRRLTAQLSIAS